MLRKLMNLSNVHVDAEKKAAVVLKRGMFVKGDEANGTIKVAADLAEVEGVLVRDVVVTDDVANGLPVSDYDLSQDQVAVGEFAGIRAIHANEQFATDQVKAGVADTDVAAGKYLAVENGVLIASPSNAKTILVSLGHIDDAGHKLLAYKVVK